MKKQVLFLLFSGLVPWVMRLPGVMGAGSDTPARVVNRTGYTLVKLYIAPTSRPAWGGNLLGSGILQDNESIQLSLPPLSSGERFFDIMAVDADGDRYLQSGVDLSKDPTILLTFRDFLEPSKEGWGWEEYFEGYGDEIATDTKQK
jgi:hypothetical protein